MYLKILFMKNIEKRTDCPEFEMKRWSHDCGDCQTDGHYLCSGCKHIASFEDMELSDNRMKYYDKEEKKSVSESFFQRGTGLLF